jgi:excisionase family DNA binding protein
MKVFSFGGNTMISKETVTSNRPTMNARKTAEYLGCCRSYVYRLYDDGRLTGYRLGERGGIRFYLDSAKEFLLSRESE